LRVSVWEDRGRRPAFVVCLTGSPGSWLAIARLDVLYNELLIRAAGWSRPAPCIGLLKNQHAELLKN